MATSVNITRASTSQIGLELPQRSVAKATRPATIQKPIPKTNPSIVPNSKHSERSGAVSRAGHHRWPQATMVVMGGTERRVFNTEILTVSTKQNNEYDKLKMDNERSNEEKAPETKTTLPDIMANSRTNYSIVDATQYTPVPSRFAAKSPSKLSQLPSFPKNLVSNKPGAKEEIKLIRNIKFWRGTTPATRENQSTTETHEQGDQNKHNLKQLLTEQDSILQSWNEQLSVLEESSKNRYFSWHMALRERLLKHEKLHYTEAVTRINKYRQRLRQRPAFNATSREIQANIDVQMWKNLLQQHGDKKKINNNAADSPRGVSMSPSKEWKPYILKENDDGRGQRKPPFFGKQAAVANDAAKKQLKQGGNLAQATSSRKSRFPSSSDRTSANYPVHGEGLLKDETDEVKNSLPFIEGGSPNMQHHAVNLADVTADTSKTEEDEKAATRALLVDLKNQLRPNTNQDPNDAKEVASRGGTALTNHAKAALGAKLRLLLQSSAQSQRDQEGEDVDGMRSSTTSKRAVRSRLDSQRRGYRPISRPHTFGDGSLPKIHNIATTSLWKRKENSNKDGELKVKHRLTLSGVANRESFSSSVIGVAQKHISNRNKTLVAKTKDRKGHIENQQEQSPEDSGNVIDINKENRLFEVVPYSGSVQSKLHKDFDEREALQNELQSKAWRKKNPAYRLYTPASLLQNKMSSRESVTKLQQKENPQYTSLKLIKSLPMQQQLPQSPNEKTTGKQQAIKGKKTKADAKHKVLRIAVVEPPLTAKERFRRQQQIEKNTKKLTFNPTHAAVTNFTAAILNSELDLRAPSSSPVDMFFRHYQQQFGEQSTAELWGMQKAAESLYQSGIKSDDIRSTLDPTSRQLPINEKDGLNPDVEIEGISLNGLYKSSNLKTPSAPKVKDLVDLQRLYHVMKKHGEAYTNNGASYVYSQSPVAKISMTSDTVSKSQVFKQHTNQKNLHKRPYYYYPYHDVEFATNEHNMRDRDKGAPLYVVTGVNSMNNNGKYGTKSKRVANLSKSENRPIVPHRHVLSYQKDMLPQWDRPPLTSQLHDHVQTPKHALTVMMPKTPGIQTTTFLPMTHLEQIQEHTFH